jgi:hypothetical protein
MLAHFANTYNDRAVIVRCRKFGTHQHGMALMAADDGDPRCVANTS